MPHNQDKPSSTYNMLCFTRRWCKQGWINLKLFCISHKTNYLTFLFHFFKSWKSTASVDIPQHLAHFGCSPTMATITSNTKEVALAEKTGNSNRLRGKTNFADWALAFRVSFFDLASCILLSKSYKNGICSNYNKLINMYITKLINKAESSIERKTVQRR